MTSWDNYFIKMAFLIASKSKDPSTQVGCVIVGPDHEIRSTGFNGFPRGVVENTPERWERPAKYEYVEHAERNAVYNAARMGTSVKGCVAYLNWEPYPCVECAKAFIQAGITEVVGPDIPFSSTSNHDWKFNKTVEMFHEAGVTYRSVPWDAAQDST